MQALVKNLFRSALVVRAILNEGPAHVFYSLFWWVFPAKVLRAKAAGCPYARLRVHILRRSGIPIGKDSEVGYGTLVLGMAKHPPAVTIEERVAIAPYVTFIASSYPDNSRLADLPGVKHMIRKLGPITVKNDAWVGAGAIIFPDVTLGEGCIVGSGAVVRNDVPPYAVVVGNPAKCIRYVSNEDE